MALEDLLLEPAGALLEDGQELPGQLLDLVNVGHGVHVGIPVLALPRDGNLVLAPLAGQVDAHTSHDGRGVAKTHRGQVQARGRARSRR